MTLLNINTELLPIKLHYFAGTGGAAALFPFMVTLAKQRGYSPVVIGLMFTMFPIPGLFFKPMVGILIDKYKCHKLIIILIGILKSIVVCILVFIPGQTEEKELEDTAVFISPLFWLFSCCLISYKTLIFVGSVVDDTICLDLLGKKKHKYGQQRLWASVGWGIMSLISGLCVDWYSKNQKHKDYTSAFVLSLTYTFLDMYIISKIKVAQNNDTKIETAGVKKLFTDAKVLTFLLWVIAFGIFTSFIMYYLFLHMEYLSDVYHPETKSWIKTIQGLSITIQCAGGEIPYFFFSSFILKRVKHMNVFSLMFFTFSVKFFLYSIIRNPVWILPVELLHGVTFALALSAIISYAAILAPVGVEGTLQAITSSAFDGIGLPIGSFIGGYFFNHYGSMITFKLLSGAALVTCVIQIIVNILINRCTKIGEIRDRIYSKVDIKDDTEENTTKL